MTFSFGFWAFTSLVAWMLLSAVPEWSEMRSPSAAKLFGAAWFCVVATLVFHEGVRAALAARLGLKPTVEFKASGGRMRLEGAAPSLPALWALSVVAPVLGILFSAAVTLSLRHQAAQGAPWIAMARGGSRILFVWSMVQMLPILPFDGGRAALAQFSLLFDRGSFLWTQLLGLSALVLLIALALITGNPSWGLAFILLGTQALSSVLGYARGQIPSVTQHHPQAQVLAEAEACIERGEAEKARALLEAVLAEEKDSHLRSKAHGLLGVLAVQEQRGPEAVGHFRQVMHQLVPPHAWAAAFTWAGDDVEAERHWRLAAQPGASIPVRVSWAATLMRLGRETEAKAVAGIAETDVWRAAEEVSVFREHWEKAGEFAERQFHQGLKFEEALRSAQHYGRAGNAEAALRMLQLARQNGLHDAEAIRSVVCLEPIRQHPEALAIAAILTTMSGEGWVKPHGL